MRVLSGIADAVDKGVVVSKRYCISAAHRTGSTSDNRLIPPIHRENRDIYYNDPAVFGSQRIVDRLVDDFAHTVGVDRTALNVVCTGVPLVLLIVEKPRGRNARADHRNG